MPRPPAFPARGDFGPVRAASPVQSRGEGPGQQTRAPHHPGSPQLRHRTSGLSRTRQQDEAPGTKGRPSNKLLVEGSFPSGPPAPAVLAWGSASRGVPAAPAGQCRRPGHREGCSAAPSAPIPAPSVRDPGRAAFHPGRLGVLIRASNGRERDGVKVREGKVPKRGVQGVKPELTPGRMPQHFLYYAFPAQGKLIPPLRASIRHLFDTHDA